MKKIVSAILVCVLLLCSVFTLASCGKSLTGKYEYDGITHDQIVEFGIFGKVTLTVKPVIGDSAVYEGKYEIVSDGEQITLTFDDADANKTYGGTMNFAQGEENGKKYIKLGFLTYNFVD